MKDLFRSLVLPGVICLFVLLVSCESTEQKEERLAKKYCGSCHLFPDPSLLNKKTWEKDVLPQMSLRMGLDMRLLSTFPEEDINEIAKSLPTTPMVSEDAWKLIQNYFIRLAPDSLTIEKAKKAATLLQFEVTPHRLPKESGPYVTLIRYDTLSEKIYVGNRWSQLYKLDSDFKAEDVYPLDSPPAHIIFRQANDPVITTMGIMDPNDRAAGNLSTLSIQRRVLSPLIYSIKRPVYTAIADLNNDGAEDYVVAAFGNFNGALLAFEKSGDTFRRHTILALPGTRKLIVKDFNNDGLNDILALITQGDEQITLFTNRGNFQFTPSTWLRFPPVYGTSHFELVDINNDGHDDIITANGDNSDYSLILKPYHGIRTFLNDGKNNFTESWFYPMHGATQLVARDFDKDNDIDIAVIAFFANFYERPEHSFLYFQNNGGDFTAQETPLAANGRWLIMESGDIDQDNDEDIMLGALNFNAKVPTDLFKKWTNDSTDILLLRNRLNN